MTFSRAYYLAMESQETVLKVAVVGDLHCHNSRIPAKSFLTVGLAREPVERHPMESLKQRVRENDITADILVCPGDLCDRGCNEGMDLAWNELRSIQSELGAEQLIGTIGNHDIDLDGERLGVIRGLGETFPTADISSTRADTSSRQSLFAEGSFVRSVNGIAEIVVIDSTFSGPSRAQVEHGEFDDTARGNLNRRLTGRKNPGIRLALLHHHPVLHSFPGFPSSDVIPSGDALLQDLKKHGVRFVIHGHRHYPRLRRHAIGNEDVFVFAAGSASAFLRHIGTHTRNLFHVIEFQLKMSSDPNFRVSTGAPVMGRIRSWEFAYGVGWEECSWESAKFPHTARFGPRQASKLQGDLLSFLESRVGTFDLGLHFPGLRHLIPDEQRDLVKVLGEHGYVPSFQEGILHDVAKLHRPKAS